ncbi:MAG: hypothetical protein A3D99_03390 [Candidatus Andersenbacteria bacterium RIFCSPHIGHO2_12_FULL_45_11]|uniref:Succinylglutamate desuccinylase/Aspartoacylase catalytic domain-containing protein n=1 Tax=Candidatus Andersenbacteria bacterium RIFCSPHIGHO2_12_FULL_45_11 TaxID=1797281 RepID=A0A1G1X3C1_9BACT|nr:MAG: hypothetical protein A3D99_03390 [Candidatus Andersenbacteria bacterium RIFCSPHIGHO2_12_FULL_45_11]
MTLMQKISSGLQASITTQRGPLPGKTVAIVAGVHGNEQGGIAAITEAISSIPIERGTVHYIIGNPKALEKSVRFTEMNLNRAFIQGPLQNQALETTYERGRAKELMPLLDTCDALLDIHSVGNQKATPFIICEKEYFSLARQFPFPIISSGWNAIEPGSTDYYMSTSGKPGLCLECGYHNDPIVSKRALNGIRIFLGLMGNIPYTPAKEVQQKEINATNAYITKNNFTLVRAFSDFEATEQDELIGHDGVLEFRMPKKGFVIFARNSETAGQEAVVLSCV